MTYVRFFFEKILTRRILPNAKEGDMRPKVIRSNNTIGDHKRYKKKEGACSAPVLTGMDAEGLIDQIERGRKGHAESHVVIDIKNPSTGRD